MNCAANNLLQFIQNNISVLLKEPFALKNSETVYILPAFFPHRVIQMLPSLITSIKSSFTFISFLRFLELIQL